MEILKGKKTNCTIKYVPHGINPDVFKKVNVPKEFKDKLFGGLDYKFVLFWMNRNIKRKHPSDVIWAYKLFVDSVPEKDRLHCVLVMHTNARDQNGTDLIAVKEAICPDYKVIFSEARVNQAELNYLYNLSDVTINIAGNEGFGLTTAESLMAETPIIVQVTGGLQDQCGFQHDGEYLNADDYIKIGSVHEYRKWEDKLDYGSWVKPVWPRVQTMAGSLPTPYIIDDKVDIPEVAETIKEWYDTSKIDRLDAGKAGREFMLGDGGLNAENMCLQMHNAFQDTFKNWSKKERVKIYKIR